MTQIKDIKIYQATSKISQKISDATHDISNISFYIVELITEQNIVGQGYLLSFHYSPAAIKGALADLKDFILAGNYHIYETIKMKQEYELETEYFGSNGLQKWAQAVFNLAMWDAWGHQLKQPVWKLLGGSASKIPVYGSGGWLSYTDQELLEEVLAYQKRGFSAVKIKVGSSAIERDVQRITKVREAVGTEIKIMIDANQGLDVSAAIKLAQLAAKLDIHWFEEPILRTDFAGYQTIRQKSSISLAMGEREYDCTALKELIRRNALDLWQPDIIRIGGVEGWRSSAALAALNNIPILPHYYKDYDVPLLTTVTNAYGAESFDWIDDLIDNKMLVKAGYAYPRSGSGWGFSFKKEFLKEVQ